MVHDDIKKYAGIGARITPSPVLDLMKELGYELGVLGVRLRTGGCNGPDTSFYEGAVESKGPYTVYLPFEGYNGFRSTENVIVPSRLSNYTKAREILSKVYVNKNASKVVIALHTRNVYQILGRYLDDPVDAVICYTDGGHIKGGTGVTIKIAGMYDIPVFNLGSVNDIESVKKSLAERTRKR